MAAQLLVIDDNEDLVESLTGLLEDEGYGVQPFTSGIAALDWLQQGGRPDVILLDTRMPIMTGPEVRERLRADPRLAEIPIIFLTANAQTSASADARDVFACVQKPFDLDDLVPLVERAFASRRPGASDVAGE